MPSLASLSHEERNHLRKSCSSAGSRSWHPLELDTGDCVITDHPTNEQAAVQPLDVPRTLQPLTPVRHSSLPNSDISDDDTVSLLSEPGSPTGFFRRRGGRRRGRSGGYNPLRMSLGQVTTESKACFPVYGCASFLLSLLVAAIFVVPAPLRKNATEDFALLPCRQNVWENFGYDMAVEDDGEINGDVTPHNRTAQQDWSWFLQQVDETDTLDRCQNEQEGGGPTVPRFCVCNNPTRPWEPNAGDNDEDIEYTQLWESAFAAHQARLKNETVLPPFTDMELILVGDSLTEHWMGTSIGRHKPIYDGVANVFQTALRDNHEKRPYIHTTPFGISGDRCSQALYRIQNGAVIPTEPRLGILTVFWVWIGTNDIIRDYCRPEQVAAGVLTIVRELRQRRPDAWVVVQSLLPSKDAKPSVVDSVNQALKCLTDSNKKAFYYNSSNIFMLPKTDMINASRFVPDGIHPNAEGAQAWAKSMLIFLRRLYDARYYH
mmetsp:Transcript_12849/g.24402  ORF Transcript_12849/g.24402 Transcript_12849/m.24402 type:complete len:489 (-) Transcript_12849:53-1519(-)|eukprot:scaffold34646_cov173-Amphora_coffeaeformis.AAC.5